MVFSNRLIGFSTGALAKGDFYRGLDLLRTANVRAVELSALREEELPGLMNSINQLELNCFSYVSVHTPTRLTRMNERDIIEWLNAAIALNLPIVVHPDIMQDKEMWKERLGNLLLIENMDKRKTNGRTFAEMERVFAELPEAQFCCDIAHAAQVDPTMTEAAQMLRHFRPRLKQIHASGVSTNSGHGRMSAASSLSISRISHLIPNQVPIILESPVEEHVIKEEIIFANAAFDPWLNRLQAEIDDVFDLKIPTLRRRQVVNFLTELQMTRTRLNDFNNVIRRLPSGGAYKPGDSMLSTGDLLARLSEAEKSELKNYLDLRIRNILQEFPELARDFSEQFEDFASAQQS